MDDELLSWRWTQLREHAAGEAYTNSKHRFNTVSAGRRSGKTERAKRKVVTALLEAHTPWAPRYFCGAPTRDQAKRIFWDDLKALIPRWAVVDRSESELKIVAMTGAEVHVVGMDKPQRIEGAPWDGGILDEYGNMKASAWGENVRPALADRRGWCDLIGVPEGRNHYYELVRKAQAQMREHGANSEWGAFTWHSSEVLTPAEIAANKEDLDPLTYAQEFEGSFISFEGRVYYTFTEDTHCVPLRKYYDARAPLNFCFDFNVDPGVCAVAQELKMGTGVIGEVHIPRNSNTPAVCRKLVQDWADHKGPVRCYGDATGGARGSAKVQGSDWDLVKAELSGTFKNLEFRVKSANPKERARINAMNSRLRSSTGVIRMFVDSVHAPHVVKDLEGVTYLKGGAGEIDKKVAPMLTHISDGLGYYIDYEFPVADRTMQRVEIGGV